MRAAHNPLNIGQCMAPPAEFNGTPLNEVRYPKTPANTPLKQQAMSIAPETKNPVNNSTSGAAEHKKHIKKVNFKQIELKSAGPKKLVEEASSSAAGLKTPINKTTAITSSAAADTDAISISSTSTEEIVRTTPPPERQPLRAEPPMSAEPKEHVYITHHDTSHYTLYEKFCTILCCPCWVCAKVYDNSQEVQAAKQGWENDAVRQEYLRAERIRKAKEEEEEEARIAPGLVGMFIIR